jgi:hypothetical protein
LKTFIEKHWPVISVMSIYWVTIVILLTVSTNMNQGHVIYALDDTYIHMAIAKNTVQHGVWGITRYEFTNSTSSPLWTFLLVITYFVFGVNEISPLVINVLCGTLAILISHLLLRQYVSSRLKIFAVLLTAVFVTPLPALTIVGMEHILHAILTLCFVYAYITTFSSTTEHRGYFLLTALAPLVTTVRFEGIFLVFVVCILFILKRRVIYSIILGTVALSPVIAYGIWSIFKGWYFLPNSVLLKGNIPGFSFISIVKMGRDLILNFSNNTEMLLLQIASSLLFLYYLRRKERLCDTKKFTTFILVAITILHMQFATTGWFYRYEAYLIFLGIVILGTTIGDLMPTNRLAWKISKEALPQYMVGAILITLVASPFCSRALTSLQITPQATHDRFLEHIQPAQFIRRYYNNSVIAINDIGAVAYFTDAKILDIFGIGSREPYSFRKSGTGFSKINVFHWAKKEGAQIAFLQIQWSEVTPRIPNEWKMVGQWEIPKNVVFGDTKIGIYAVNALACDTLIQNLQAFGTEMPVDIIQYGIYTEQK